MTDYLVSKVVIVFSVLVEKALREDSNYVSPNSKYKAIRELEVGVLQLWHFHKLTAMLLLPLLWRCRRRYFSIPNGISTKSLQSGFAIWICKTRDEEGQ